MPGAFGLAGLLLWQSLAAAQIPFTELHALAPSAAQIGSTFELRIASGSHTEELERLDFSLPLVSAEQRMEKPKLLSERGEATGIFRVSVPSDAEPGICEVRAVGRFGVSNPRSLLLTKQPILHATTDHSDSAVAIDLQPGQIVFAQCQPQKRNYYHIQLGAGDVLQLSVYAQQLDSKATATAVLYGPKHQELARSRSVGAWPAIIEQQVQDGGDYLLAIHDFLFQGGTDYPYVLEAKASCPSDQPSPLELDDLLRPSLSDPLRDTSSLSLNQILSRHDDFLVGAVEATGDLSVPFRVQGDFADDASSTIDFRAKQGQPLWIKVHSASLDQLTDPRIVIYKVSVAADADSPAKLTQVAEQDDAASFGDAAMRLRQRDPQFGWTAAEDGLYRLVLSDYEAGARPRDATRFELAVYEPRPHFELIAFPPFPSNNVAASRAYGANVLRGGTEAIRILAMRMEGFSEAIEVSAIDLPVGVTAQSVVIPASASDNTLMLVCADDAPAWSGPIKIIGRSLGEPALECEAQPATIVWPASATRNAIESRQSRQLVLGVNSADVAPLLVKLGDGQTLEVKQGEKLSVPIQLTRRPGGDAACLLRPQNLPPKVSLGEITIPADKSEATAELSIASDAPLGESTFWMQNETKVKWSENPQALEREQAYLATLNQALAEAISETDKPQLEAAIKTAADRIEELKKRTAEKQLTVWLPTTVQRIRVIAK